ISTVGLIAPGLSTKNVTQPPFNGAPFRVTRPDTVAMVGAFWHPTAVNVTSNTRACAPTRRRRNGRTIHALIVATPQFSSGLAHAAIPPTATRDVGAVAARVLLREQERVGRPVGERCRERGFAVPGGCQSGGRRRDLRVAGPAEYQEVSGVRAIAVAPVGGGA